MCRVDHTNDGSKPDARLRAQRRLNICRATDLIRANARYATIATLKLSDIEERMARRLNAMAVAIFSDLYTTRLAYTSGSRDELSLNTGLTNSPRTDSIHTRRLDKPRWSAN